MNAQDRAACYAARPWVVDKRTATIQVVCREYDRPLVYRISDLGQAAAVSSVWWVFGWKTISLESTTRGCWWQFDVESVARQPNQPISPCRVPLTQQHFSEQANEPTNWPPPRLEYFVGLTESARLRKGKICILE